jgi:ABC-type bacteriocin transporter
LYSLKKVSVTGDNPDRIATSASILPSLRVVAGNRATKDELPLKKKHIIRQRDITDCGAACLASVAAHYGLFIPVSRIRYEAGTDQQGTNMAGLIEAATTMKFEAIGAKGPPEALLSIPLPAIAHVIVQNQLHHFVVIYGVNRTHVTLMDPGEGRLCRKKKHAFINEWTGALLLLRPADEFSTANNKKTISERFRELVRPHGAAILSALLCAIIYTVLGLATPVYIQRIIDEVLIAGNSTVLNGIAFTMILLLLLELITGAIRSFLVLKTGQQIDRNLILGYYQHLLRLPQRFFDTMRVGEIISRVNDAVKIRMFINEIACDMVVNGLIICFSVMLMLFYYWKLALIMLAIVPVYVLLYRITNTVNKKWQRVLMESQAGLESQLVESVQCVSTIKQFGLEQYAGRRTQDRFLQLLSGIYQSSIRSIQLGSCSDLFTRIFTIAILWAGAGFVTDHAMTPGELLSFFVLVGYFTGPVSSLIGANKHIQDALIAADRLFEIIDLETEQTCTDKIELTPSMNGDILFSNIHFRYANRHLVFDGLHAAIPKGSMTAIVGETGSGKSTLLALLQSLYPPTNGQISIGGINIQQVNRDSLRRTVSVVPQQVDLFAGTVAENIAIGDPHADMNRIISIAAQLGIDEFIETLPNGYHSMLHEHGVNLSGGQKQRLAIARALYRDPQILALDEATASLDAASEQKLHQTLQGLRARGRTIMIIAHRMHTIKNCDNILVLGNGKIIEQGDHETLLRLKGRYHKLWQYHVRMAE